MLTAQREYKRKKNLKKAQRLKQLEEEREMEKNKWLEFNAKVGGVVISGDRRISIMKPLI